MHLTTYNVNSRAIAPGSTILASTIANAITTCVLIIYGRGNADSITTTMINRAARIGRDRGLSDRFFPSAAGEEARHARTGLNRRAVGARLTINALRG